MREIPTTGGPRRSEHEVWLESLANLGKRLIAPPSKVDEKAPAGEQW
jgi:hypothetical protein